MAPEKSTNISKFTNSLMEFLINAMADRHSEARHIAQRLNNLKVYMDPLKVTEPHFFVSIGISEACYSIETGKKMDGSLGPEDGYVSRWAGRSNIASELRAHWKKLLDAAHEEDEQEEAIKKALDMLPTRKDAGPEEMEEDDDLGIDMMGTGRSKFKRDRGKRRYLYKGELLDLTPEEYAALLEADALAEEENPNSDSDL
jgi:hypothetical protein